MVGDQTLIKWREKFHFLHQIPSSHPHHLFRLTSARHQCHAMFQYTHHFLSSYQVNTELHDGLEDLQ